MPVCLCFCLVSFCVLTSEPRFRYLYFVVLCNACFVWSFFCAAACMHHWLYNPVYACLQSSASNALCPTDILTHAAVVSSTYCQAKIPHELCSDLFIGTPYPTILVVVPHLHYIKGGIYSWKGEASTLSGCEVQSCTGHICAFSQTEIVRQQ